MKFIVACATDDGRTLTSEHFGHARAYAIYEVNETTCTHLQSLLNPVNACEGKHADLQKAKSMITLLADKQVQVLVAKRFSPNIGKIKQSFVPIIVKDDSLEDGCLKLIENQDAVIAELHKGQARSFLLLS